MSKQIKQLAMDALKQQFQDVRELVLLSVTGLDSQADNALRANLRKKNIHLMMVKNSLARRAFNDLGMAVPEDSDFWKGNTWMAWGPESVAELSQELDRAVLRDKVLKDKVKAKGAITEGAPLPFEQALRRPTRAQALSTLVAMIIGPASEIASQITGPASQVASQIETRTKEAEGAEAAPAAPAAT
jgi:large subunit ribosomal protein L10